MAHAVSRDLIIWLIQREAIVTRAYPDGKRADGSLKYSIGVGSQDPPPKAGDVITISEAIARLRENIASREAWLNRKLTVELTQSRFDAFFSLAYRAGTKAVKAVGDLFNAGEPILATAEFIKFVKADGKPNKGLIKRAIREMAMAELGYYGDLSKVPLFDGDPNAVFRQMIDASSIEGL